MENQPNVSALLLTIGESTTAEAHHSLLNQSAPLHQILVIENQRPFSSAFNLGLSSVTAEFFVQCDADMILDPNCVEVLISRMKPETGMVVGYLRDPLQGRVRGVKLYRTDCCRRFPLQDSSDCEEIFRKQLLQNHWNVDIINDQNLTLGNHVPDCSDSVYQFERFKYQGAKISARKAWDDLAYRLIKLAQAEDRRLIPLAVSAMICGFYLVQTKDHLKGFVASAEYRLWQQLTAGAANGANGEWKVYTSIGTYNFILGYSNGYLCRRQWKSLQPETLIRKCMDSKKFPEWAYLLGFCSSITLASETIGQNILTRSLKMRGFLRYFRKNLDHFLTKD